MPFYTSIVKRVTKSVMKAVPFIVVIYIYPTLVFRLSTKKTPKTAARPCRSNREISNAKPPTSVAIHVSSHTHSTPSDSCTSGA